MTDPPANGSAEAVAAVLEAGYVFEVTYREEGIERTLLLTHREPHRPAMKPLRGPPLYYFDALDGEEVHQVRLPELVDVVPVAVEDVPAPLVGDVVASMASDVGDDHQSVPPSEIVAALEAARDPERGAEVERYDAVRLGFEAVREERVGFDTLGRHLFALLREAETATGTAILETLRDRAQETPAVVEPHVADLADLVAGSAYRTAAVRCLVPLAEATPTAVVDAVPALVTVAESTDGTARECAVYTLSLVADDHPEELQPAVGALVEATRDETTRTNALSALGKVANAYPHVAAPVAPELAGLLDADEEMTRANAVGLLGDIAQEHPETVVEHADGIARRLTDTHEHARRNASIALLEAGEADPDAITEQHEHLEAALDDPDPAVRANACALVANAEAPVSVERLRELRSDDPDETVRDRAAWALGRLS